MGPRYRTFAGMVISMFFAMAMCLLALLVSISPFKNTKDGSTLAVSKKISNTSKLALSRGPTRGSSRISQYIQRGSFCKPSISVYHTVRAYANTSGRSLHANTVETFCIQMSPKRTEANNLSNFEFCDRKLEIKNTATILTELSLHAFVLSLLSY